MIPISVTQTVLVHYGTVTQPAFLQWMHHEAMHDNPAALCLSCRVAFLRAANPQTRRCRGSELYSGSVSVDRIKLGFNPASKTNQDRHTVESNPTKTDRVV
eukprot:1249403-Amphidinium_carterae.1